MKSLRSIVWGVVTCSTLGNKCTQLSLTFLASTHSSSTKNGWLPVTCLILPFNVDEISDGEYLTYDGIIDAKLKYLLKMGSNDESLVDDKRELQLQIAILKGEKYAHIRKYS